REGQLQVLVYLTCVYFCYSRTMRRRLFQCVKSAENIRAIPVRQYAGSVLFAEWRRKDAEHAQKRMIGFADTEQIREPYLPREHRVEAILQLLGYRNRYRRFCDNVPFVTDNEGTA